MTVVPYIDGLVTSLQSIAELNGKVFPCVTEQELIDISAVIQAPGVAVVYGGVNAFDTDSNRPAQGRAGSLSVAIVVFYKVGGALGVALGQEYKNQAIKILDDIRNCIKDVVAPNSKKWVFSSELPAVEKGTLTLWVQRWNVPVIVMM